MFARKREVKPLEQTYPEVAEKLHFDVTQSVLDQIAAALLRNMMAKYVGHKMAIERCDRALDGADLSPAQKVPYSQKIAEESKLAQKTHAEIIQQFQQSQIKVQSLPPLVFDQVAENLGLASPKTSEEVVAEPDLLGESPDKKTLKEQAKQQKEQEKTIQTQAKDFYKTQEALAEKLEKETGVENIEQRITNLNNVAIELEKQAKPTTEIKEVPKQVPADYEQERILKEFEKQSAQAGFSEDTTLQ